jgi:hypothetical protein
MEMYPAVIYPSGAGFCYKDSISFNFTYPVLYGKNNNDWKKINVTDFLYPIGSNYINHIISRFYWIENPVNEKVYDGIIESWMQNQNIIRARYRKNQLEEFKIWTSKRLYKNGFEDKSLKIELHQINYLNNDENNNYDSILKSSIIKLK